MYYTVCELRQVPNLILFCLLILSTYVFYAQFELYIVPANVIGKGSGFKYAFLCFDFLFFGFDLKLQNYMFS